MLKAIKSLFNYFFEEKEFTLFSGFVDIIVIKQPDDTLKSSAFHIRFGTLKALDTEDVIVNIKVND